MAVYKRSYRPYEGRLTAIWARPLVITRYGLEQLFQARTTLLMLAASAVWPMVCAVIIYLNNSVETVPMLNINPRRLMPVNEQFFFVLMNVQGFFAFLLTAYAGPALVAPDLGNNALPLYLCRPLTRVGYVLGKMAVLAAPLSLITWVPALALWTMQAKMAGAAWWSGNLWLPKAIIVGSWVWILFLSLMALALSAFVRWRMVASALQFGIFLCAAGFSEAINAVMQTKAGYVINIGHVIGTIWMRLFRANTRDTIWRGLFSVSERSMPEWQAWLVLAAVCMVCVLLLEKRLRGREVVS